MTTHFSSIGGKELSTVISISRECIKNKGAIKIFTGREKLKRIVNNSPEINRWLKTFLNHKAHRKEFEVAGR